MAQYRKKPVVIEARQFDGTTRTGTPIIGWIIDNGGTARWTCNTVGDCERADGGHFVGIDTLEGTMRADAGDFIIKGVQGEFYPCKPDIFEATYEAVELFIDTSTYDEPNRVTPRA
jgi:hypothetical protein